MSSETPMFYVKDCALAAIATGVKAHSLLDLKDRILEVSPNSIYYHFWGGRLRTSFEYREYHNDFSFWAHHSLHDDILAERLGLLNPTEYETIEDLRNDAFEIIDERLEECSVIPWAKMEEHFHFINSKIVVFQTSHIIKAPIELVNVIPKLSASSIFYHVIDAARRCPDRADDFSIWLQEFKGQYQDLIQLLRTVDPYFISLSHLQEKLCSIFTAYFINKEVSK